MLLLDLGVGCKEELNLWIFTELYAYDWSPFLSICFTSIRSLKNMSTQVFKSTKVFVTLFLKLAAWRFNLLILTFDTGMSMESCFLAIRKIMCYIMTVNGYWYWVLGQEKWMMGLEAHGNWRVHALLQRAAALDFSRCAMWVCVLRLIRLLNFNQCRSLDFTRKLQVFCFGVIFWSTVVWEGPFL